MQRFSKAFVLVFFSLIIAFLAVNSLLFTCRITAAEEIIYQGDSILPHILISVALIAFLWAFERFIGSRMSSKAENILIVLTAAALIGVMLLCVFLSKSIPIFDQWVCALTAFDLSKGYPSTFIYNYYLHYFPFQIPFVLYLTIPAWLGGGSSYIPMQLFNVAAAMLSVWALADCAALLFDKKRIRLITWLGCLAFLPLTFYTPFVYGNLPGLALMLLGARQLISYLKDRKKFRLLWLSLFLLLASLLKMNYSIAGIAAGIILVLDAITCKKALNGVFALLLVVLCLRGNSLAALGAQAITGEDFSDGFPTSSWIMIGLEETEKKAPGWYNNHAYDLYQENKNKQKVDEIAKREIAERIKVLASDREYSARFFYKKLVSQWNEPSFQSLQVNEVARNPERAAQLASIYEGSRKNLVLRVMDEVHWLILLGSVLWLILEGRRSALPHLFFPLYIIGGFLFHMFWEAKGQYTFSYFICLIPYAASGFAAVAGKLTEKEG